MPTILFRVQVLTPLPILAANAQLGKQQMMVLVLGPCNLTEQTQIEFLIPYFSMACGHLRSRPMIEKSLSLSLFLSLLAFQIKKKITLYFFKIQNKTESRKVSAEVGCGKG